MSTLRLFAVLTAFALSPFAIADSAADDPLKAEVIASVDAQAKALAMTMVDLYQNPDLVQAIKAEFRERKGDYVYEGIVPPGPPPLDFEQ
ncbi:hypothetical protein [Pseudohaliea sp.]|uniref:hypothetical protein n=1 Tax=Pseudohaliea sp. TaxID=2740289 RepID=UPI0032EDD3A1